MVYFPASGKRRQHGPALEARPADIALDRREVIEQPGMVAALRGGLAVALGFATGGVGALLPLLDFGTAKDSDCAALMKEARAETGVKASDMQPR